MSEKRIEFMGYEWEEIGGKWLVKIDDLFYEIEWNCSESLVDRLNEQQATISRLEEENEQLQKENTFLIKQRNYWKSKFKEGTETFESNIAEENELLKQTNEKLAIENANLEQSIKFLNNKINTLKETNLTLVKEIRKLPITDKQFKEINDKL